MHEWALAEGVIATALKAAEEQNKARITRIAVTLGELQQISCELFAGALKEVLPEADPRLEDTQIDLQIEEALLQCRACGHQFAFADAGDELAEVSDEAIHFVPELAHSFVKCPGCSSPDFAVVKGRGVWIDFIEGE